VSAVAGLIRVALIGPECTGKTSLAEDLAHHYGVPWSPEYARAFVDAHPRDVEYADVAAIGRGQLDAETFAIERAMAQGARLVIHDTDLVSTLVYSQHYYSDCPAWIAPQAHSRLAQLYLLHDIDVPWVEEGFQRAAPDRRIELLALFQDTLARMGAETQRIAGSWSERREQAVAAIDGLLARPTGSG
jgi:nicotinamide riboside kinase